MKIGFAELKVRRFNFVELKVEDLKINFAVPKVDFVEFSISLEFFWVVLFMGYL